MNSQFKKHLNLQIHLHKTFFVDDQFLESVHKSFLNQTTLDLRKEKWVFLNRELTLFRTSISAGAKRDVVKFHRSQAPTVPFLTQSL